MLLIIYGKVFKKGEFNVMYIFLYWFFGLLFWMYLIEFNVKDYFVVLKEYEFE